MKPGVIKLRTNPDVCQGCRSCEAICSLVHTEAVCPSSTGISIRERESLGSFEIFVCQQCFDIPCAEVCPAQAIVRNGYSGAVEINENCTGCGNCVNACPFNAIRLAACGGETKAYKCDLCGGLPECVGACPRQALSW